MAEKTKGMKGLIPFPLKASKAYIRRAARS